MIAVTDLCKRYGSTPVLDGMSFTARDGAITTLLGVNGAGKTTTLRIVCGLLRADGGDVAVDGIDMLHAPEAAKSRMGILPDRFGLYPHLTAKEHLEFFGRLQGLDPDTLAVRVGQARAVLEMEPYFDRPASQLSLGQGMRVALGRALLHHPRNVVMDEPTRGLDVLAIRTLRRILRELRDQGHAILVTNHAMMEVEEISDTILVLAGGRVAAQGSAADICRQAGTDSLEEGFVSLSASAGGVS